MATTMEEVIIRPVEKEEIPVVARLVNSLYKVQRPDEYFSWQWFNDVYESILIGGFVDNELIGVFGVQKKTLTNGLKFGYVTNLNVAEKWQGKGYFSKLGACALSHFRDLDFTCVFANKNAKDLCQKIFGLRVIGGMHLLVLDQIATVTLDDGHCEEITKSTVFPDKFRDAGGKVTYSYLPRYRLWRFALHPVYRYHMVKKKTGEFAVIKTFIDPVTKECFGDIVDFECPLSDREKLANLYLSACCRLKAMGVDKISTWGMPGTLLRSVLDDIGFKESNYQSYYCVKVLNPACSYLYDFSMWHLREADATNY